MTRITSHIGAVVQLIDVLQPFTVKSGRNGQQQQSTILDSVAAVLNLETESVAFGKVMLWISAFIADGRDAITRSSLEYADKEAARLLYSNLTKPFTYPFTPAPLHEVTSKNLNATTRSHLSLLNSWMLRDDPIYIPDITTVEKLLDDLQSVLDDFDALALPAYIKSDFSGHIRLYQAVAKNLPMVAHLLIVNESTKLFGWLMSSIPDDAKKVVSRAALTLNVLVAAFVSPAEATDAYGSYKEWFSSTHPQITRIEQMTAPLALPAPAKNQ